MIRWNNVLRLAMIWASRMPAKEGMREITELVKIRLTNLNSVGKAE